MSNGNRMITFAGPEWTGEEVVMTWQKVPGQVDYVRTEVMSKIQCEYFVKTHNKICIYLTIFIYTLKYWNLSNIFSQAMQVAVH
jgi:hypothetical protein